MKYILALLFLCSFNGFAQETKNHDSPKIIAKMKLGQQAEIADIKIDFVDVLSDSRCPKGVDCVWPGEAKIQLRVTDNMGAEEKTYTLGARSGEVLICETGRSRIYAHSLKPSPVAGEKIKKQDYYLELYVEKLPQD